MRMIIGGLSVAVLLAAAWAGPGGGGGTPTVTVEVRKLLAQEGGSGTGKLAGFVLRRAGGDPDQTIVVAVSLSGTAVNGQDYQHVPATVTMPGGGGPVTVVIDAIDDPQNEADDETVVLRVMPGLGYIAGSPATQEVRILDNDQSPF